MSAPTLAERAVQRRALNLALAVECPDRLHWHARPGVPCTSPDDEHEWGWVCLPRIEYEATTRAPREALQRQVEARKNRRERDERREENEAHARARAMGMAMIAAAPNPKEQS